ncbi:sodium:solute symporter family transporter [Symmachiella dynata]|uniref:sodium:solute symporter family transporter n=1 Tax=Symmachiella dynata TaxID=2527995 RepID=UPI0030EE444D
MTGGLHWIDGVVVASYIALVLWLGWYYSRRQTDTGDYFTGNHAMPPLLIGISLFATLFSTISFLSTPGELINKGPVILTGMLAIPLSYIIVGYLLIPVYMRQRVTSAYELLETRLGLPARMLGAVMFVLLRLSWMSMLIYLASKAVLEMLDLSHDQLQIVAAATGAIAIIYASMGGLRAVVITDLLQFLLLFGGAVLVIVMATVRIGGIDWFPTSWNPAWDTQPLFSWDPYVRVTVFGTILHGVLWWVCTAGGDQTAIQRFMATRDASAARRSFLVNSIAGAAVSIVLALVGFSLLGFYQAFPAELPEGKTIAADADILFPRFISHELPVGLSGLVVCGMFAAAMSSIDSGVNSISAVVMTDFIDRFRRHPVSEQHRLRIARWLAFGIGVAVVMASAHLDHVPGNFLEKTKRTIGLFVAPMFSLFFMAVFVRFATAWGAIVGAACGFLAAAIVAYWNFGVDYFSQLSAAPGTAVIASEPISYQWIFPVSLVAAIVCGCVASGLNRLFRRDAAN